MNEREQSRGRRRRGKEKPKQGEGQPPVERQSRQPGERQNRALDKFKKEIANKGFADDAIMRLSRELGESLVRSQAQLRSDNRENTKTQVRKFYNLVRITHRTAGSEGELRIKLRTLQAQIAYAVARRTISEDFKDLFDISIEKVLKSDDAEASLSGFVTFFEAFYAYFYYQIEMDKNHQGGRRR